MLIIILLYIIVIIIFSTLHYENIRHVNVLRRVPNCQYIKTIGLAICLLRLKNSS